MTAQIHERLILDGEATSMTFCPPLAERHERVIKNDDAFLEDEFICGSTACWRGYLDTWEIRDDRFYLAGLEGSFKLLGSEPLLADWFTGVLRVPRGELLDYVHMGFGSVYEEEVHVEIRTGEFVGRSVIDNRGKDHDPRLLGWKNLPGSENQFEGDGRRRGRGRSMIARWFHRFMD